MAPTDSTADSTAGLSSEHTMNASATASTASIASTAPVHRSGWTSILVAILFGLVYAYYLYDAINSMVQVPAEFEALGMSAADAPWGLLTVVGLVPIVTYVGALVVGRRRTFLGRVLIFAAGLGVLACLTASAIALA